MSETLPTHARAVVIGGGILGTSVAYHLTRLGWRDVVLLERGQLTNGTTWHAAGLLMQVQSSRTVTEWGKYNDVLIPEVEALTGMRTGFRRTGSILMASTESRRVEVRRSISMAHAFDVEVHDISATEAQRMWPLLDTTGLAAAAFFPNDSVADATDLTHAMAAAAQLGGARIHQNTPVIKVLQSGGRVTGVRTPGGDIAADTVVNCTGMWAREFGRSAGVAVPLHAAEHFYLVTDTIPDLAPDLPVLRMPDEWTYAKEDAGKLLVGFVEATAKPWATMGIPDGAEFIQLPEDWDHLADELELAARRLPIINQVGIMLFFNGPESFTPDDRAIVGPSPELAGYWVAAGFNSHGLRSGGGAGRSLAEWIASGEPQEDLWEVDLRRFSPMQANRRYLHDRITESVGLLYAPHWPFRQVETARGVRRTPFYDRLSARGACFGELMGWERANWYAPAGVEPRYEYSHGRQNWFPYAAEEHAAARAGVALFDESTFGKLLVTGADACRVLNRICTANTDVPVGHIVYTQWLNEGGGIVADVTVTRLDDTSFLVATSGPALYHDLAWLRRHVPEDAQAVAVDVSNAYAVLGVMGPRSRELLAALTDADLSNDAFPFATSREIDLGYAFVRASRMTYVGELGWELWIPADVALHVYDRLVEAGDGVGLRHAGFHAMDSLRIEKAYRGWGYDIGETDTPLEAGLSFTLDYTKPGGFIGRDAALRQRDEGARRRLVVFALEDPEPLLAHNEPILRDGVTCGWITSAAYGHTVGSSVGMGYVGAPAGVALTPDWILSGSYELEIANERFAARPSLRPLYDPANARIRS